MVDNAENNLDLSENGSKEKRNKKRNLCLGTEAYTESVPLLRAIPPHPVPAAMRGNEARNEKRNIRKESSRNVVDLNLPLKRPVNFVQ